LNNAVINRKLIGIRQSTVEEWLVYYLNSGNCEGTDYKSAPAGVYIIKHNKTHAGADSFFNFLCRNFNDRKIDVEEINFK